MQGHRNSPAPRARLLCLTGLMTAFVAPCAWAQGNPDLDKISSSPIPQSASNADPVLVPGKTPLTERMVTRYTATVSWLLEIPFTPEQRAKMRAILLNDWKQQKPSDIKSDLDVLAMEAQVAPLTPDEREVVRRKLQPEVLKNMRADTGNPDTSWLLSVYDATHRPIAAGNPPLTRQMSDSFAELACFMIGEAGGKRIQPDQTFKEAWAELMKQKYPGFNAEQQKSLGQMPEYWATLHLAWGKASAAEQEKLRDQWKQMLQSVLPRNPQQVEAERAMADLTALAGRTRNTLTPADLNRGATDMEIVARELRREGGEKNLAMAAQAEQTARQFRMAANPRPAANAPTQKISSQEAYARCMAELQSRHSSFTMMMNMNTISHVANMNAIATMGGSPYRYEVKYH